MTLVLLLVGTLAAKAPAVELACAYDGDCRAPGPAVDAQGYEPLPEPERDEARGPGAGFKKGAEEGATLGFFAVMKPAAVVLDEGLTREDEGRAAGWHYAAGSVLAILSYVPAMAAFAVGAVLGAIGGTAAELLRPGSTARWDGEGAVFD